MAVIRRFDKRGNPRYYRENKNGKLSQITESSYYTSLPHVTLKKEFFSDVTFKRDKLGRIQHQQFLRDQDGKIKLNRKGQKQVRQISSERYYKLLRYENRQNVAVQIAVKRDNKTENTKISGMEFSRYVQETKKKSIHSRLVQVMSDLRNWDRMTPEQRKAYKSKNIQIDKRSGNVIDFDKRLVNYDNIIKLINREQKYKSLRDKQNKRTKKWYSFERHQKQIREARWKMVQIFYGLE